MQLGDAVVHLVQLGGHRIQLGLDHSASLIDEVDGLIRQEAIRDVAVRQRRGGDQCVADGFRYIFHVFRLLDDV